MSEATLDFWAPPSSSVEPAIAASIVFVGIENIVRKNIGKGRAWLNPILSTVVALIGLYWFSQRTLFAG